MTYQVGDQYHLVGGAIEVGESTHDAVVGEVSEELGVDCQVQDLAFVVENRFDYQGELHHMIEFHYLVDLLGNSPEQTLDEGAYFIQWLPLDQLNTYDLRPEFLKVALLKVV